jgi:hypothetical protein
VSITRWWRNAWARLGPRRRIIVVEGDSLPKRMPRRDLVLAQDAGEDWCVGMRCPCGCGDVIELLVIEEATPRWDVSVDPKGRPSLSPSSGGKRAAVHIFGFAAARSSGATRRLELRSARVRRFQGERVKASRTTTSLRSTRLT